MGKLYAWERSAKLNHVNSMVQLRKKFGLTVAPEDETWADLNRELIATNRQRLWKTDEHPAHRSGARSLQDAAVKADRVSGKGARLERYYVRRYRPLCWATHGSGLLAVENYGVETFPHLLGEALYDAATFGMMIGERVVVYLQAMTPEVHDMFERAELRRRATRKIGQAIQLGELGVNPRGVNGITLLDPVYQDEPEQEPALVGARQALVALLTTHIGKERRKLSRGW